ncbi:hypothetical protein VST7929_03008 [Vibrio stylophorae]|uniref:histidine kinase n=1 Tax=Vibrio stylophorae TaxID=659351 RepID=A0ABM8ZXF6_9VIBR|nr:DUF3404 domain-containing protein [Vibrio stylophorae]CAH0535434.1 hypothetical protein VST7929_03008 [Vibrio stylophorae]
MRKIFTLMLCFIPHIAFASMPERVKLYWQDLGRTDAIAYYDLRDIQSQYPVALLDPAMIYPQTSAYPLKDLKWLYSYAQQCKGNLPIGPLVTQPLVFSRAMCNGTQLPKSWFTRAGYIHPGGGSYALRYIEKHPKQKVALDAYLHIKEKPLAQPDSLLGRLQRLDHDALNSLLSGSDSLLSGDELWLRDGNIYRIYERTQWQPKLAQYDIFLEAKRPDIFCQLQKGNVCWQEAQGYNYTNWIIAFLLVANLGLLLGWLGYRVWVKRREMQQRMVVLQILTHELRTPIASLGMTVEGFRREFDKLPDEFYDEFRRLCEDSTRLRQLAEASKDYLQSHQDGMKKEHVESINEWLTMLCEELDVPCELSEDRSAMISTYWLATCIDNLVRNAKKYGIPPATVRCWSKDNKLLIAVCDNGKLQAKDWMRINKPFVSERGLGLGLTIVESMVQRMGGKIKLQGPPTQFILEIPCE